MQVKISIYYTSTHFNAHYVCKLQTIFRMLACITLKKRKQEAIMCAHSVDNILPSLSTGDVFFLARICLFALPLTRSE